MPGEATWPARQEAEEVAWLLGAPFLVQLIEGSGEEIAHVIGGSLDYACANWGALSNAHVKSIPISVISAGGIYSSDSPTGTTIRLPRIT